MFIRDAGAGGRDARNQPNAEINAMIEATAAPITHRKRPPRGVAVGSPLDFGSAMMMRASPIA